MIEPRQLVAVDVGNSSIKLAAAHGDVVHDHAIPHSSPRWEQSVLDWALGIFGEHPGAWRMASVRRSTANQLSDAIYQRSVQTQIQFVTHHHVPMPVVVDHPDRLGIDRLLSAFAASRRAPMPAVVIDAGSAVTVDWVSASGEFCGGAILPGLGLQSRSLSTETEALPQLQWDDPRPFRVPARNTADAIRAGILVGLSAAIDELIDRYEANAEAASNPPCVFLTGGDASTISSHLRHNHQVVPNLVCRGLLELPRSLEGSSSTTSFD